MQHFTPKQYLQIDIANNFGLDQLKWHDRLGWFEANEAHLERLVEKADEPALFYAGVQAYRDMQSKKPSGYLISLDATSSGLQLLACLTGDRKAAELCNVVDVGNRMDAYTAIYHDMVKQLGDSAKIERKSTKSAIMTAFYSSIAEPKKVFGDGPLLAIFFATLERMAPAAWECNTFMKDLWQATALSHDWVLPDNFHVQVKVMNRRMETVHFLNKGYDTFYKVNEPMDEGRSLGANTTHSVDGMVVREMVRRCDYNPLTVMNVRMMLAGHTEIEIRDGDNEMVQILWGQYEKTGYLSARILDHLNQENMLDIADYQPIYDLINSLPAKPFKLLTIHDCFRCHPNYAEDLRIQYNNQLYLIAKSNILSSIIGQILGRNVQIGKLDPKLYLDIPETDYALS